MLKLEDATKVIKTTTVENVESVKEFLRGVPMKFGMGNYFSGPNIDL